MPLITAVLAVSRVLRQLIGEDEQSRRQRIAGSQHYGIKTYKEEFVRYFPTILSELVSRKASIPRLTTAYDHLEKSLNYNAFGDKMTTGLMVVTTLSQLNGNHPLSTEEKHLAFTLGYCIEILRASNFIADDIVDGCETRSDKPCWYKQENIGMIAVNDSFWLNSLAYVLLIAKFRDHACYTELIDLFHLVVEYADLGDIMARLASDNKTDLNSFTMESFQTITKYRTGYFYFYLPVMAALYMAEINGTAVTEAALPILLAIGEFYQYQADFTNCFGGADDAGSDIQGRRCTWLIVQALNKANSEQKAVLEANYGKSDKECVKKVKAVYEALNLRQLFAEYEEQSYQNIGKLINDHSDVLPAPVFLELRDRIYSRH